MEDKEESYVYIILTKKNTYYTGMAGDYCRRWMQHESGNGARYLKSHGFEKPVFLMRLDTPKEARNMELKIKKLPKSKKYDLINSDRNELTKEMVRKYWDRSSERMGLFPERWFK